MRRKSESLHKHRTTSSLSPICPQLLQQAGKPFSADRRKSMLGISLRKADSFRIGFDN